MLHPRRHYSRSIARFATGILLAIVVVCLAPATAEAQTRTWLGTFTNAWSNGSNWSGGVAPSGTNTLVWSGLSTGNLTSTNDIGGLTATLTFSGGSGPISLSGSAITLGGNISGAFTGTVTIGMDLNMASSNRTFGLTGAGSSLILNGVISSATSSAVLTITNPGSSVFLNGLNTFAGNTTVGNGTAYITTLADSGVAQSLGAGSRVTFGFGSGAASNTGNVVYTGSTAASTNKQFQFGNSSVTGTQSGGFFNNGSGVVTWTGAQSITNGGSGVVVQPFTLGGSNAGDNTWASAIKNNTGYTTALTKADAGKWILSGSNGYTGATSITGGLLVISSTGRINTTSGVTVNGSGAEFKYNSATAYTQPLTLTQGTVSGTGTISASGGVTIGSNAVISPGNSPGIQAYTTGLTWASGGSYLWEINDWTGAAGTAYDQVQVTGNPLNITATSGSPFTINITSLSGTAAGAVANWSNTNKTFTIATALSGGGVTGFDAANFSLNTTQFTAQNPSATGSWSISATGSTVLLNYTASSASATTYTLAAAAGASAIHVGGTTSITATVTNTGTGTADSLAVSGLGVTVSPSGSVSISPTSGTAANGNGTVVGSGNFTPVSSGSYSFSPSVASATNVTLGGAATATGTTSASVTAWNYAAANSISGTVNFGAILAGGTFAGQSLTISNVATNDGFSEQLDAAFGTPTGSASGSGSISLLSAGGTSTAMSIYLGSGSAGAKTGSLPVNFTSNGLGTSGLGTTSLAPQTVFLSGTVLDPAVASFGSGPGATTSILLSFGTVSQYSSPTPLGFDLYNLMQTNGFTADLALLTILSGTGNTGDITTTLATFNDLAAGSSNGYTTSLATTTIGSFENVYTLQFKSANGGTAYSGDSTQSLTLTVQGFVVVPEPTTLALVGAGLAVSAAEVLRRRRRRAAPRV